MFKASHIEDTIDDIKRIIYYYSDSIDYTVYIRDLEKALEMIQSEKKECSDQSEIDRLVELEEKVNLYLTKMNAFQRHYKNQDEEPEK